MSEKIKKRIWGACGSRWFIIACVLLIGMGTALWAGTVTELPYGVASPYWYNYSSGAKATYYLAAPTLSANDTAVGLAATQTLTNKTLTSPTIATPTLTSPTITGATLNVLGNPTFEGATAGTYDLTLAMPELASASRTVSFLDMGANSAVLLSTLTTNTADAANSVWGVSNGITFEGATANNFETTLSPDDPKADRTITLVDYSGSIPLHVLMNSTQITAVNTTSDVGAITLADGWLNGGESIDYELVGTKTGANVAMTVTLYIEDAAILVLQGSDAAAGDWTADLHLYAAGSAAQDLWGCLKVNGKVSVCDYAADTTNSAAAGTIPVKAQIISGHASDTVTSEVIRITVSNPPTS